MFSLIITIISIALVAALALATIYYGGTAFNKGSAEAKASQLINEGQQINGAVAMLRADIASGQSFDVNSTEVGVQAPSTIAHLTVSSHLAQVPTSFDADGLLSANVAQTANTVTSAVCDAVNLKAGIGTKGAELTATGNAGKVYGCFGTGETNTVFYRF